MRQKELKVTLKNLSIAFSIILLTFLITGCASLGGLQVTDEAGHIYQGEFSSFSKSIEVEINTVKYSGFYITDAGVVGNVRYSGHTGRATLSAMNGDTMQCEFNYQGLRAIGTCLSSSGDKYRFSTK